MASHPKLGVGYNAQVALDAKHKLIVEQHVTNAGSDLGLLAPTAGPPKRCSAASGSKPSRPTRSYQRVSGQTGVPRVRLLTPTRGGDR